MKLGVAAVLPLAWLLSAGAVANPDTMPVGIVQSALGQPFTTRHARFEPIPFDHIPGWGADASHAGFQAFARSCTALSRTVAWRRTCAALNHADIRNDDAARHYFEQHFQAYAIMPPDGGPEARIRGYYQPELSGSRRRSSHFRYPVYAAPRDLYELDAHALRGPAHRWLRLEGRRLLAVAAGTADAREYQLALSGATPGPADQRYRVRVEGNRILPYYTRQQIESQGIDAAIIAWVESARALYTMQMAGSGSIRLRDGSRLWLAYAQHNGQPPLIDAPLVDTGADQRDGKTRIPARATSSERTAAAALAPVADAAVQSGPQRLFASRAGGVRRGVAGGLSGIDDPAYVFFRVTPNEAPGTLGVALAAGRSLAVDPRIMPLGAPVFVTIDATRHGANPARLMSAQDSSYTIHKSIRARIYQGAGSAAGKAAALDAPGRLWLLLPAKFNGGAPGSGAHLHGTDQRPAAPNCVIPGDSCVEN